MTSSSRLFEVIIVKSWWVILLLLCCLMVFDLAMRHKRADYSHLLEKRDLLQSQLVEAKKTQLALKQEMNSQEDQDWIEIILMRNLGLVPIGATKIVFE